jgi:hypothetical protein
MHRTRPRHAVAAPAAAAGIALLLAGAATAAAAGPPFVAAEREAGLDFVHFTGASGELYFPEITGAGGALFDYDGDGDLDVYLVQGAMLGPGKKLADARFPPTGPLPLTDRLFRNDLDDLASGPDGRPRLRFTDVTKQAGLAGATGYGMGATAGDYDGDGHVDLYVTNFGSNQLWHNRGDGTFEDATARAGVDDRRWSVSAAFFDYDRDGRLDLYVGNYVDFTFANQVPCIGNTGERDYCGPSSYRPETDRLFRNRGDGTFEDATGRAGLGRAAGAALGVAPADFDGDGWTDLYVANDGAANFLWINRRDGTFEDQALLRGCALNADGRAEASMGVDVADADGDGDEDVFLTHLNGEKNTLYVNDGSGMFLDRTGASGLATPSWNSTGFGTAWIDYDGDGLLDLLVVNGAVKGLEALQQRRDPYPFHQPDQLFRNQGGGRFREVTAEAGEPFRRSEVGRGALFGDLDDDGDTDVVVVNNNGPARLLLNAVGNRNRWIGVVPVAEAGGEPVRDTRVEVAAAGRPAVWRRVRTAAGSASTNAPRVLVGLGAAAGSVTVRVHWPGGGIEEWSGLAAGRYHTLVRGTGKPPAGGER